MARRSKFVVANDKVTRVAARARFGKLQHSTIKFSTLRRYFTAVYFFNIFLVSWQLGLAESFEEMDGQLCLWLEHLWETGEARNLAADTLSGAQHLLNKRQVFPGSWRLLRAWTKAEVPTRAPPLTIVMLLAIVGWLLSQGVEGIDACLYVGFHCMLRTEEMLTALTSHVQINPVSLTGVIALPNTKRGQTQAAWELVTIDEPRVGAALLRRQAKARAGETVSPVTPITFRKLFKSACEFLGLDILNCKPYSVRRGGATHDFLTSGNLQRTLFRGRWQETKTAKIYINDGLAFQTAMSSSAATNAKLHQYAALAP